MKSENTNGQPANMKQNQYTLVIAWTEAGGKGGGRRREHRENLLDLHAADDGDDDDHVDSNPLNPPTPPKEIIAHEPPVSPAPLISCPTCLKELVIIIFSLPTITPVRLNPYTQMSSTSANPVSPKRGLHRGGRGGQWPSPPSRHTTPALPEEKIASARYLHCVVHLPGDIAKATLDQTY